MATGGFGRWGPLARRIGRTQASVALGFIGLAGLLCPVPAISGTVPVLYYAQSGDCVGAAASAGDLDGDGFNDFLVGEPTNCPRGAFVSGSVRAYSGSTGTLLYRVQGETGDFGRAIASVGDIDGDGLMDFVVGAPSVAVAGVPNCGSIYAYSGAAGSLLYRVEGGAGSAVSGDEFGTSVAAVPDVDGDGKSDLLVGAPRAFNGSGQQSGACTVLSGVTGLLLRRIEGPGIDLNLFGVAVAGLGDTDGDGTGDLLIGAPRFVSGFDMVGAVYVYSGSSGALLYKIDGYQPLARYGSALAVMGNIDGDGRCDFAVTAPDAGGSGAAFVYSGATGTLIRKVWEGPYYFDHLGASAAAGDVNGDGVLDLILGAPAIGVFVGSVFVVSGADWSLLLQADGAEAYDYFGEMVANVGDVNGDHRDDMVARAAFFGEVRGASLVYGLADVVDARTFTGAATDAIRLGAGTDPVRVQLEPVNGSFALDDVLLSTISIRRPQDPFTERRPVQTEVAGDTDLNGTPEITTYFAKQDLRDLFGVRTARVDTATVTVVANLRSGKRLQSDVVLRLISSPPLAITLAPNPARSDTRLSFITTKAGVLKVRLFDIAGHLLRDLADEPSSSAGYHDIAFDGRDLHGKGLPSGIYFVRIESAEGAATGRVALVR